MNANTRKDHIAGALYGLAAGDALLGPWTREATRTALAVAEGIVANPKEPFDEITTRLVNVRDDIHTNMSGTNKRVIFLATTSGRDTTGRNAPEVWEGAAAAAEAEGLARDDYAVPRAVYPAIFYRDEQLAALWAKEQGHTTHMERGSSTACIYLSAVLHYIIKQAGIAESLGKESTISGIGYILKDSPHDLEKIKTTYWGGAPYLTGYAKCALDAALYCWYFSASPKETLTAAKVLKGRRGNIGAIVGALAGAYYGAAELPANWTAEITTTHRERLDAVIDAAASAWDAEAPAKE